MREKIAKNVNKSQVTMSERKKKSLLMPEDTTVDKTDGDNREGNMVTTNAAQKGRKQQIEQTRGLANQIFIICGWILFTFFFCCLITLAFFLSLEGYECQRFGCCWKHTR